MDTNDRNGLPAGYRAISSHPEIRPGGWAKGVVLHCETGEFFLHQPNYREPYHELTPLADELIAIIDEDTPLERIWPALTLSSESASSKSLVVGYFQLAQFDANEALSRLIKESNRSLHNPHLFRHILYCIEQLFRSTQFKDISNFHIENCSSLTHLLLTDMNFTPARSGTDGVWHNYDDLGWDLGPSQRSIISSILSAEGGPDRDRVPGISIAERMALFARAGLDDIFLRRQAINIRETQVLMQLEASRAKRINQQSSLPKRHSRASTASPLSPSSSVSSTRYLAFLPAAFLSWFLIEVVAPGANQDLAQLGMVPMGMVFYAAAASRVKGMWDRNVVLLYIQRVSAVANYFLFALLFIVMSFLLSLVLAQIADIKDPLIHEQFTPVYIALLMVMLTRFWPMMVIPFIYPGAYVSSNVINLRNYYVY